MEEKQWLAHNIVSIVLNLPGQQVALPCGHRKPWEVACGRVVVLLVWGSRNLSACGRIMLLKGYVLFSLCSPPNSFTECEDEKMGCTAKDGCPALWFAMSPANSCVLTHGFQLVSLFYNVVSLWGGGAKQQEIGH